MPPRKPQFEDEEETSSGSEETSSEEEEETKPSIKSRQKFDDEEDDSDVLDDWEADSEAEREKAKKEAAAKAKAAAAAASKKSKAERIEEYKKANAARRAAGEDESSDDDEDETSRRIRNKAAQRDADMRHAEDLFGNVEISREKSAPKTLVNVDPADPSKMADLSELAFFRPTNKTEFQYLREKLTPLVASNHNKPQYTLFLQEFAKQLAKDLPSDQIKKIASSLTTLSNEKMKEEKNAEKGGKKTKAAKTKATLVASRNISTQADVEAYDDGMDESLRHSDLGISP